MEKYVRKVFEMGAEDAKIISAEDIIFDLGTTYKRMYGSKDWGRNWTSFSARGKNSDINLA